MDPLDVELEDPELLDEVELTAAVIVAANQSDRHLTADEIDEVLGLTADTPKPSAESGASEGRSAGGSAPREAP